jgi:menaquinone-dependent protoporphyrinogen IX oxidase
MVRSPHDAWAASEHQTAYPAAVTNAPPVNDFEMDERKTMKDRILIVYASRCESTGEVAPVMAEVLVAQGHAAEVQLAKQVQDLTPYSAVIVGSAIRMGKWLPEAVEFVTHHQARLSQLPTAFFTVHMLNVEDNPESQAAREAYIAPVRQVLIPSAEAFFAGKYRASPHESARPSDVQSHEGQRPVSGLYRPPVGQPLRIGAGTGVI